MSGYDWHGEGAMNLELAIGVEDALECMKKHITKEQFVACSMPSAQAFDRECYETAERMVAGLGSWQKAMNAVTVEIEKYRRV
jgi:hypothetical protein